MRCSHGPPEFGRKNPPLILSWTNLRHQPPKTTLSIFLWLRSCPWPRGKANSAAGKACLSNGNERFTSSANTDGNGKGKGWSSLSTKRGVFLGLSVN